MISVAVGLGVQFKQKGEYPITEETKKSSTEQSEPEKFVETHVDVAKDALTDAIGVVVPGVSSEPSEPKQDETEKDAKEKKS